MKQTIVSDVDGIILNFLKTFLKYINSEGLTNITEEDITSYNFKECSSLPDDIDKNFYIPFTNTDNMSSLPYIEGALEFFTNMSRRFNLVLLTAMDKKFSEQREKNLTQLDYHDIIYSKEKLKHVLDINPKYIFEDDPDMITQYEKSSWAGIIFVPRTAYTQNYGWKKAMVYSSWCEVLYTMKY